jgi:hypothetical protein
MKLIKGFEKEHLATSRTIVKYNVNHLSSIYIIIKCIDGTSIYVCSDTRIYSMYITFLYKNKIKGDIHLVNRVNSLGRIPISIRIRGLFLNPMKKINHHIGLGLKPFDSEGSLSKVHM